MIGKPKGERRLADPFRSLDQDGMVALSRLVGAAKEGQRRIMTEERQALRRRACAIQNAVFGMAHRAALARLLVARVRMGSMGSTML